MESLHIHLEQGPHEGDWSTLDMLKAGHGRNLNALLICSATDKRGLEVNYSDLQPFPFSDRSSAAMGHGRRDRLSGMGSLIWSDDDRSCTMTRTTRTA